MGEIRDNFKKAMSDMFGVGGAAPEPEANPTEQAVQQAIKQAAAPAKVEPPTPAPAVEPAPVSRPVTPAPAPTPTPTPAPFVPPVTEVVEETYISRDTVICGDIQSGSRLRVRGKVAGNIVCENDVVMSGQLEGNMTGKNALVDGGRIVGNVDVRGDLRVHNAASIKGDLQCSNLDLDSAVDGNLRAQHKSVFHANATVIGNIATQTIVVEEGAMIEGYVSMKEMQSMTGRPHFNREEK